MGRDVRNDVAPQLGRGGIAVLDHLDRALAGIDICHLRAEDIDKFHRKLSDGFLHERCCVAMHLFGYGQLRRMATAPRKLLRFDISEQQDRRD